MSASHHHHYDDDDDDENNKISIFMSQLVSVSKTSSTPLLPPPKAPPRRRASTTTTTPTFTPTASLRTSSVTSSNMTPQRPTSSLWSISMPPTPLPSCAAPVPLPLLSSSSSSSLPSTTTTTQSALPPLLTPMMSPPRPQDDTHHYHNHDNVDDDIVTSSSFSGRVPETPQNFNNYANMPCVVVGADMQQQDVLQADKMFVDALPPDTPLISVPVRQLNANSNSKSKSNKKTLQRQQQQQRQRRRRRQPCDEDDHAAGDGDDDDDDDDQEDDEAPAYKRRRRMVFLKNKDTRCQAVHWTGKPDEIIEDYGHLMLVADYSNTKQNNNNTTTWWRGNLLVNLSGPPPISSHMELVRRQTGMQWLDNISMLRAHADAACELFGKTVPTRFHELGLITRNTLVHSNDRTLPMYVTLDPQYFAAELGNHCLRHGCGKPKFATYINASRMRNQEPDLRLDIWDEEHNSQLKRRRPAATYVVGDTPVNRRSAFFSCDCRRCFIVALLMPRVGGGGDLSCLILNGDHAGQLCYSPTAMMCVVTPSSNCLSGAFGGMRYLVTAVRIKNTLKKENNEWRRVLARIGSLRYSGQEEEHVPQKKKTRSNDSWRGWPHLGFLYSNWSDLGHPMWLVGAEPKRSVPLQPNYTGNKHRMTLTTQEEEDDVDEEQVPDSAQPQQQLLRVNPTTQTLEINTTRPAVLRRAVIDKITEQVTGTTALTTEETHHVHALRRMHDERVRAPVTLASECLLA